MTDRDDPTRRGVLRSGVAALGAGALTGEARADDGTDGLLGGQRDQRGRDARAETDEITTPGDAPGADDLQQIPTIDLASSVETALATALPEAATGIRPGSQLFVERDGAVSACSANFVWRDASDGTRYLGAAGHCFLGSEPAAPAFIDDGASEDGASDDGASEDGASDDGTSDDPGSDEDGGGTDLDDLTVSVCTECTFGGFTGQSVGGPTVELGDVVYARQADADGVGIGNDFGLVEIPAEAEDLVDPSMPQFGGPAGALDGVVPDGDPVVQYGAGIVNGELFLTQGRRGFSLGDGPEAGSWTAALRATPGDSGSGLLAATDGLIFAGGPAAGVLTHVTPSGVAGTSIDRCKELVAEDGLDVDLELVEP
jgi:hypothetical protein